MGEREEPASGRGEQPAPATRATRRDLAATVTAAATAIAAGAGAGAARRRTPGRAPGRTPAPGPTPTQAPGPAPGRFLANAYIQRTTNRSAAVRVAASAPVTAVVCVSLAGGDPGRCEQRITRDRPRRNHVIPVRGLRPDTTYTYRVTATPPEPAPLRGDGDRDGPGPERPSKAPGVIKESDLRSAPVDPEGAALQIEAGPQVVALATVAGARWATNVYGNGRMDYEAEAGAVLDPLLLEQQFELPRYANRKLEDALTADHRVCIGPLTPETVYGYSVTSVAGSSPDTSRQRRFATLATDGAPAGAFEPVRRFAVDLDLSGIAAMSDGAILAWSRAGVAAVLRPARSQLVEEARLTPAGPIGGGAAAPDGRLFLSLPGPANNAGIPTAIVRIFAPSAGGYAAVADLGLLIGAPGALAFDASGNLAALTTLAGDDGIPEAQFNLFDADPGAAAGFTLRFALQPFGQATAMAGTRGGSLLLLAASRAIVALAGDIHDPDGAVTVWDGRNAGQGPWIEAAAIAAGPLGDLYLVDGCTGALQVVDVDPASGLFSATAAGNTRDVPGGLAAAPAALAVDRNGTALVLERGTRTIAQFRLAGAPRAAARMTAGNPLDPAHWRPVDRARQEG
ncbi:MAG: hypothetical protein ACKOWF_08860 [Chloroflexota bacterium]